MASSILIDVTFSNLKPFIPLGEEAIINGNKQRSSKEKIDGKQNVFSSFSVEEEIFFYDNIIIWHKGQLPVRTFHLPSKVQQVVFCHFEGRISTSESQNDFVAILHEEGLKIFDSKTGQEFVVILPCRISSIFCSKSAGILLQSDLDESILDADSFPRLFSLKNPLEEIKPIVVDDENSSDFNYIDKSFEIISLMPIEDFDILLLYNSTTQTHSLWKLKNEPFIRRQKYEITYEFAKTIPPIVDHVIHPDFSITKLYEDNTVSEKSTRVHMSKYLRKEGSKYRFLLHRLIASKLEIFDVEISESSAQLSLCTSLRAFTFVPLYGTFSRHENYLSGECELLVMDVDKNISLFSGSGKTKLFRCLFKENSKTLSIINISDPIYSRLCITENSGKKYRIDLSLTTSNPMIDECLHAMNSELPFQLILQTLLSVVSLEGTRQEKRGTHNLEHYSIVSYSPEEEWVKFCEKLLQLAGETNQIGKQEEMENEDKSWEYLLNNDLHTSMLNNPNLSIFQNSIQHGVHSIKSNLSSPPHKFLPKILLSLHLLYENYKLNNQTKSNLRYLATILSQLSIKLNWRSFVDHYSRDFGDIAPTLFPPGTSAADEPAVPDIFTWISGALVSKEIPKFPILPNSDVCELTRKLCRLFSILRGRLGLFGSKEFPETHQETDRMIILDRFVKAMVEEKIDLHTIESLPFGVSVAFREAIRECKHFVGTSAEDSNGKKKLDTKNWSRDAYILIGREDLANQVDSDRRSMNSTININSNLHPNLLLYEDIDSSSTSKSKSLFIENEVTYLRFHKDLRLKEVKKLLSSSQIVSIKSSTSGHENEVDSASDHQSQLLNQLNKTLSASVGRGMFVMSSSNQHETAVNPVHIPPLSTTGRLSSTKASINLDKAALNLPGDFTTWVEFHNGVAVGLKIDSLEEGQTSQIADLANSWFVYHRVHDANSHAGLLMALGLQGHLGSLALTKVYEYFLQSNEVTSTGLLLGMCANKRGTMDASVAKILTIHVPALLPPSSTSLFLPTNVQISALIGIGLLYQSSANRRMTELLLAEIGRKPSDTNHNNFIAYRESYSLAAGIALGMVTLGHGTSALANGLSDLHIEDTLSNYITGSENKTKPKDSIRHEQSGSSGSSSMLVLEGNRANVDITSPGASIALAFISIASRLALPSTKYLLDYVRPDFLLLRVLCRSLILWDSIDSSETFINSQIPEFIKNTMKKKQEKSKSKHTSETEAIEQSYLYIIAGACMSIGLKYAGSAKSSAVELLLKYIKYFEDQGKLSETSNTLKFTRETCIGVSVLALACVMSGTGDLKILALFRRLRSRTNNDITYGQHMAVHMAIGLLFLGGGRFTLSTSNEAIVALVCSLYPQFPVSCSDNRYHLQALRHLYVLASEPRCIEARDIDTNQLCFLPLEITLKGENPIESNIQMTAPCLLPDFSKIKTIKVISPRYWPQVLDIEGNPIHSRLLKKRVIYVKRRIGFLSYLEDPKNYRSILSRSLSNMKHNYNPFNLLDSDNDLFTPSNIQRNESDAIESFSNDPSITAFAQQLCGDGIESSSFFTTILNECLTQEKPEMLQHYLHLFQFAKQIQSPSFSVDNHSLWSIKLLIDYYTMSSLRSQFLEPLIQQNFLESLHIRLERFFISESGINSQIINNYLQSGIFSVNPNSSKSPIVQKSLFGNYLTYFGVPLHSKFLQIATKPSVPENLVLPISAKLNFVNILLNKSSESHEELVRVLRALKIWK